MHQEKSGNPVLTDGMHFSDVAAASNERDSDADDFRIESAHQD
jgi:hypothetical protein